MLEIDNIKVKFKNEVVLKGLSLNIQESKIFGILGSNGAGKTTLFESIYQTLKYKGTIKYNHSKIQRKDVAYLETENYFYPFITGREYLSYFSITDDYDYLIKSFNLPLDQYVQSYSSGMKKKLAFMGVLLLNKPIIILDEPFNGVDFEGVNRFYKLINQLRLDNKIVIISSHIIETLFHTCDSIGLLENGTISNIYSKNDFMKLRHLQNK